MRKKKIALIVFSLVFGIMIYFFYRSKELYYFRLFKSNDEIYNLVINMREYMWNFRRYLPLWFVYSLPDGLWIFSFGIAILYERRYFNFHFIIFTGIYLFMIILEFIQLFFGGHGTKLGTFDIYDIVFFTIGYGLSVQFSKNTKKQLEISKIKELHQNCILITIFIILGILPSLL